MLGHLLLEEIILGKKNLFWERKKNREEESLILKFTNFEFC